MHQGGEGADVAERASSEVASKLSEATVALDKSGKAAKKLFDLAGAVHNPSIVFEQVRSSLLTAMEAADTVAADLGFLIKFDKTRSGQRLTVDVANSALATAGKALSSLMDTSKSIRALLPRKHE